MNATLVDLRYRTKDIMRAIARHETVRIFAHGKLKAEMTAVDARSTPSKRGSLADDPYVGSQKDESETVAAKARRLRNRIR